MTFFCGSKMGKATADLCVSAQSIETPCEFHQLSLQNNWKTSFFDSISSAFS